jgi:hypothetical protein
MLRLAKETSSNLEVAGISELIKVAFELFKSEQVKFTSEIIKCMEVKSKVGFDCLKILLDSENQDILKFIPVFIIPVIQNI